MKQTDYEYLGDDILHVYIPAHYPLRVKLMVLAALKTYKIGNKSIDYMLKKYGNAWAEQFEIECSTCGRAIQFKSSFNLYEDDFIVECYRCGQFFCKNCLDREHPVSNKNGTLAEIYCVRCSGKRREG